MVWRRQIGAISNRSRPQVTQRALALTLFRFVKRSLRTRSELAQMLRKINDDAKRAQVRKRLFVLFLFCMKLLYLVRCRDEARHCLRLIELIVALVWQWLLPASLFCAFIFELLYRVCDRTKQIAVARLGPLLTREQIDERPARMM